MRVYVCKSNCGFSSKSPVVLGQHYKENPEHKEPRSLKSQSDVINIEMSLESLIQNRDQLQQELKHLEAAIENRLKMLGLKWDPNFDSRKDTEGDMLIKRSVA